MEIISQFPPSVCFQVEKIIGVSVAAGNVRNYQVQWAPTWVSGLHLVGCDDLIASFYSQMSDSGQNDSVDLETPDSYPTSTTESENNTVSRTTSSNTTISTQLVCETSHPETLGEQGYEEIVDEEPMKSSIVKVEDANVNNSSKFGCTVSFQELSVESGGNTNASLLTCPQIDFAEHNLQHMTGCSDIIDEPQSTGNVGNSCIYL